MPQTLLLDTQSWDLILDINGNIAIASEPYSLAQDAASAIKTFKGEVFYDTTVGIPYFGSILGKPALLSLLKSLMVAAAESVTDVASAQCVISNVAQRAVTGQVQITSGNSSTLGQTSVVPFTIVDPQGP